MDQQNVQHYVQCTNNNNYTYANAKIEESEKINDEKEEPKKVLTKNNKTHH